MAEAIEETITDPKFGNVLRTGSEQRKQACDLEQVERPDAQPPPRMLHAPHSKESCTICSRTFPIPDQAQPKRFARFGLTAIGTRKEINTEHDEPQARFVATGHVPVSQEQSVCIREHLFAHMTERPATAIYKRSPMASPQVMKKGIFASRVTRFFAPLAEVPG